MARAATSVVKYYPFFAKERIRKVLDYGAGTLRNSCFLAERGCRVYAADIPEQVERICRMSCRQCLAGIIRTDELPRTRLEADLVVSTYVLNIIPGRADRIRYLQNAVLNLRPGGYLLLESRCPGEDGKCIRRCPPSLKCEKCLKTFSLKELDRMVKPLGFRRICHYRRRHALAVVYRLQEH